MRFHVGWVLFSLLFMTAGPAFAEDYVSIEQLINTIDGVNRSNAPDTRTDCDKGKEQALTPVQKEPTQKFQTIKNPLDKDVKISVLSEEKAKELFKRLKAEGLNLKKDCVCAQRAHLMSFIMEQEGIESGKVFAVPRSGLLMAGTMFGGHVVPNTPGNEKGSRSWKYHVAPFVYVEKDGKIEEYVFDPLLFKEPVPRTEWEKMLTSHPDSSNLRFTATGKGIFRPNQMYDDTEGFIPSEIQKARQGLYSPYCADI
ncbi:MAG: hypothetical protein KF789_06800 [Bdellovibrionaceae bacterium]|nr:hypothetical protein [Pseudobdellovibrionaceae bacterium]